MTSLLISLYQLRELDVIDEYYIQPLNPLLALYDFSILDAHKSGNSHTYVIKLQLTDKTMLIHDLHHTIQDYVNLLSEQRDNLSSYDQKTFELFLLILNHQLTHNLGFKNYVQAQESIHVQKLIVDLTDFTQLPSLPTDTFKHPYPPTTLTSDEITKTFLTSGTTTDVKGSHHLATTSTYETSILAGWRYCNLPPLQETFFLTPSATEAPHSSLSHMMETLKKELNPSASFILNEGSIDHLPIIECAKQGRAVTIIGTALAFLQLFEILEELERIQLPAGSWALETGGYKGSEKSLTKEELYQKFQIYLGIKSDQIWNEYSMTELSSQFYTNGIGNPHIGPPWAPIKVINPETNLPVETGELGYLVIYDLANVDSVVGIRTQDFAIYHNPNSFTLIGRDPSALPRGCSRSS